MSKINKYNALFLDRDGIINKLVNNRPPWSPSEIIIYPEAHKIINLSLKKNYIPVIVTNQPDAGRGKLSFEMINKINKIICEKVNIKESYICMHPYDGLCDCRKPKPGMLLNASAENSIILKESFMIGDRDKDIQAGIAAGCKTIFLSRNINNHADFNVSSHQELYELLLEIL